MITYHLLLARKHGEAAAYPLVASFGDRDRVQRKYDEISGPGWAAFAAVHAEILYVSDGTVLAHHDAREPALVESARKNSVLAEARAIVAAAEKAKAGVAEAKDRIAAAVAAVRDLTPEQKELLAEDEARIRAASSAAAQAAADAKAAAAAEKQRRDDAEAQAQLEAEAAQKAADEEAGRLAAASAGAPLEPASESVS